MDFNGYIDQAQAFLDKKNYGPAIENLRMALDIQPGNEYLQEMIGKIEALAHHEAEAYRFAAEEADERAKILGITITDVDQVIAEYIEMLERNPNDDSAGNILANAYYIRGLTFISKREHIRAIEDYKKAINYMPDKNYPHAVNKLGHAYSDIAEHGKAIETFEELKRLNPNYRMVDNNLATAYQNRGFVNDQKGYYNEAIADYKKSLQYRSDDSATRELLKMAEAALAKK
jgi:tetratricopeptide (TPR) repeat protein